MTLTHQACIAIVIEGGGVQSIVIQGHPKEMKPPHFVVVDYDIKDANPDELIRFALGGDTAEACCSHRIPDVFEEFPSGKALNPTEVRLAIDNQQFRQDACTQVRDLIAAIKRTDRESKDMPLHGTDYENLRRVVLDMAEILLANLTGRSS
jgi:ferredoxin